MQAIQRSDRAVDLEGLRARAKELRVRFRSGCSRSGEKLSGLVFILETLLRQDMQKVFAHHKPIVLRVTHLTRAAPELQDRVDGMNRDWSRGCSLLQQWDTSLRKTFTNCQVGNHKRKFIKVLEKSVYWPIIDLFSTVSFISLGVARFPLACDFYCLL